MKRKFEISTMCLTPCPKYKVSNIHIGSLACQKCEHCIGFDLGLHIVDCNYKEKEMKINYEVDKITCSCGTLCPHNDSVFNIMVGSVACQECEYFGYVDTDYQIVGCNYGEEVKGHSAYRLNNTDSYNDLERKYTQVFKELCRTGFDINYFGGLNDRGTGAKRYLTDEEKRIVLTVIQWLGTPVGQTFLGEVK